MKRDPEVQISLSGESPAGEENFHAQGENSPAQDTLFSFLSENRKILETVAKKLYDEVWPAWRDHRVLQISLKILGEGEMAKINAKFRNVDEPTDVLTFPLFERGREFAPPHLMMPLPLGDILLCMPVIRANAKEHGTSEEGEAALVLFHGLLHLLAWDHDTPEHERKMWQLQEKYRDLFLTRLKETHRGEETH